MNDVALGLQVTGIGMALVFLTLIIVMFAVWLLSWAFRPKEDATAATAKEELGTPVKASDDGAAMAAAIAVAIARQKRHAQPKRTARPDISYAYEDDEIVGEVVYIAQIDSGSGAWKGQARLNAIK